MSSMDEMMSAEEMDALAAATSTEFDQLWVEMMIAHHEGAISMAEEAQEDGVNPDVNALAGKIIERRARSTSSSSSSISSAGEGGRA